MAGQVRHFNNIKLISYRAGDWRTQSGQFQVIHSMAGTAVSQWEAYLGCVAEDCESSVKRGIECLPYLHGELIGIGLVFGEAVRDAIDTHGVAIKERA